MSDKENKERIADLMSVIPYCNTRDEALAIQEEILELENESN